MANVTLGVIAGNRGFFPDRLVTDPRAENLNQFTDDCFAVA
jgi:hypothetical protein